MQLPGSANQSVPEGPRGRHRFLYCPEGSLARDAKGPRTIAPKLLRASAASATEKVYPVNGPWASSLCVGCRNLHMAPASI